MADPTASSAVPSMYVELGTNKRVYLVAKNRQILSFSEQYATHWNAKRAAKRMFPGLEITDRNGNVVQNATFSGAH